MDDSPCLVSLQLVAGPRDGPLSAELP
jgi:hypothetical protein